MKSWFDAPRGVQAPVYLISGCVSLALGLLARRGSWYTDDLDFLVQGGRGFSPDQLLTPVNDHIAPGLRLVYAAFAHIAPLSYDLTVLWRVILQAAAIILMGGLLLRLVEDRRWVYLGTLLYAVTPLTMPSFMSLSSAVNNLPAHVCGLVVVHSSLDWFTRRTRGSLAIGAAALIVSLCFWEKSVLILLTAAALGLRHEAGHPRSFVRAQWPWLVSLVTPVLAFGAAYLTLGQMSAGTWPGVATVAGLIRDGALQVVAPAFVGGPWQWFASSPPYFGLSDPPATAQFIGAATLASLVALAWRRSRSVLWLWAGVGVYVVITVAVVSYGRFAVFGPVLVHHYHYWTDVSIPLTLATVLTISGSARSVPTMARTARPKLLVTSVALSAWLVGAVASDHGFATLWSRNPSGAYLANLREGLNAPNSNVWDTDLPLDVSPFISKDRNIAAIMGLGRLPGHIQAPGSEPQLVDATGHLKPAMLKVWATGDVGRDCAVLIKDRMIIDIPLSTQLPDGAWFARIGYLGNPDSRVHAQLVTLGQPQRLAEFAHNERPWPAGLATVYLGPTERVSANALRLTSDDPAANICVGNVDIGRPEVQK